MRISVDLTQSQAVIDDLRLLHDCYDALQLLLEATQHLPDCAAPPLAAQLQVLNTMQRHLLEQVPHGG